MRSSLALPVLLSPLLLVIACEPMPASNAIFEPVRASQTVQVSSSDEPQGEQGDFDFESDGRAEDVPKEIISEHTEAAQPVESSDPSETPTEPQIIEKPLPSAALAEPPPARATPSPSWTSPQQMAGSFGVRLVSTTYRAQPPRAILGLPDGREEVVRPGDLLPEVGVVILAIGQDVIQIAEVLPQGDHAEVNTKMLQSLFPQSRTER